MQRFGEKLRSLRQGRGLTTRELADALEIASYGHIGDLERGRRFPSTALVIKIAHFFNVSADQLLFDELNLD